MAATTRAKTKNHVPLVIEPYPEDYSGYPFVTLLQYRKQPLLTIVDNSDDSTVTAYVLDYCGPENVDEKVLVELANDWYTSSYTSLPLSIYLSKRGMSMEMSRVYRTFNIEFISRVIGPVSSFPINSIRSIKRRQKKSSPPNCPVVSHTPLKFFTLE